MPVLPLRNTRVGSLSESPVASSSPAKTRSTPPRALPYRMSPGWSGTPRASYTSVTLPVLSGTPS
eukprot:9734780-Prorocentrum_lima.AAC.1